MPLTTPPTTPVRPRLTLSCRCSGFRLPGGQLPGVAVPGVSQSWQGQGVTKETAADEALERKPVHVGKTAQESVQKWLQESGTPLELATRRAMRTGGAAHVEHARYYIDVKTEELRETDVVADFSLIHNNGPARPFVALRVVAECKGKDTPWVAFVGYEILARTGSEQLPTFEVVEWGDYKHSRVDNLHSAPIVASIERHAYQIADTGKSQHAYKAVRQVMSAVLGLKRDVVILNDFGALYFVPVVVTASALFTYRLLDDGTEELLEVDRVLLISRLVAGDTLRSVWIVRDHAVQAFAADVKRSADRLASAGMRVDP